MFSDDFCLRKNFKRVVVQVSAMKFNIYLILAVSICGICQGEKSCGLDSCSDLKTVKGCNNIQECIEKVWSKQKPTGMKDQVCDICLKMVKEARDQLNSNETKEEISEVLEGSCKMLFLEPAVKLCVKLADEFVPELVAMLSSQMDPEVVCTVAKLCNNDLLREALENSEECKSCRSFTSAARNMLEKISFEKYKEEKIKMCRGMGSYSDACYFYFPQFAERYYNQTKHILAKRPCNVLGVCPSGLKEQTFALSENSWEVDKARMCKLCPAAFKTIRLQMIRLNSMKEFQSKVNEICQEVTLYPEICSKLRDNYYRPYFYHLKDLFDPDYYCKNTIAFCSSSNVPVRPLLPENVDDNQPASINIHEFNEILFRPSNLDDLIPIEKTEDARESTVELDSTATTKPKISEENFLKGFLIPFRGTEDCRACVNMFDSVNTMVTEDKNYLKNILGASCDSINTPKLCIDFINKYYYKFEQIFRQYSDSKKMCPELVPNCLPQKITNLKEFPKEATCKFCLKTLQSFNQGFNKNFKSSLDSFCDDIPKESRWICKSFVEFELNKAIKFAENKFTENQTCTILKLCGSSSPQFSEKMENRKSSDKCEVCLITIEFLYQQLKGNETKAEVAEFLEHVCSKMPASLKDQCISLVENHMSDLIEFINHKLKPKKICSAFDLCKDKETYEPTSLPRSETYKNEDTSPKGGLHSIPESPEKLHHEQPLNAFSKKISCDFCLRAMQILLDQLQNEKTEEAIRKALDGLCKYLPSEVKDTCKNLINQYAEDIVDMIIADFNANELCTYMKLCGPKDESSAPVFEAFNVKTNEIFDSNVNVKDACQYCKFLQHSIKNGSGIEKTIEGLTALLVDMCSKNKTDSNENCKKLLSEGGGFYDRFDFSKMDRVCHDFKICPFFENEEKVTLQRMHLNVQECALCELFVETIHGHPKMTAKNYNFTEGKKVVCATVPKDKNSMCQAMIVSYGPSISELLKNNKPEKVCGILSLCDKSQQAKLNGPVGQLEPIEDKFFETNIDFRSECMQGPSFWCSGVKNAKKCGTFEHCRQMVWKKGIPSN